nr:decaprenyl-phosphate phosphoribosyltransferase [Limnofasciculus baicalensis]
MLQQKNRNMKYEESIKANTPYPVGSSGLLSYLMALRPRQWTKNLVVFAAPLFAFSININSLAGSFLAFVLFCAASSSFYLINDIADVKSDRQHPVKCKRPIAAGLVKIPIATGMAFILLSGALIISWLWSGSLGLTILAYVILQTAYNITLKRRVILDVIAIATGFVLRATAGGAATGIYISPWFLLCTAMLALFLAIEKRKAELRAIRLDVGKSRSVLKRYSLNLLSRMESVITANTIMTYALWSSGPQLKGASTPWMILSLPFVVYGVFRYQLLSDPKEIARRKKCNPDDGVHSERPEEVLLRDIPTLLTVLGWILTVFIILFLKHEGVIQ